MVNKYNRKKFQLGGGAGIARDKKMSALPEAKQLLKGLQVPNVNPTFDREKAIKFLGQEKSKPINPKQKIPKGRMKAVDMRFKGVPSGIKGILKQANKFARANPDKVKKVLQDKKRIAELMKKLKELRKK